MSSMMQKPETNDTGNRNTPGDMALFVIFAICMMIMAGFVGWFIGRDQANDIERSVAAVKNQEIMRDQMLAQIKDEGLEHEGCSVGFRNKQGGGIFMYPPCEMLVWSAQKVLEQAAETMNHTKATEKSK